MSDDRDPTHRPQAKPHDESRPLRPQLLPEYLEEPAAEPDARRGAVESAAAEAAAEPASTGPVGLRESAPDTPAARAAGGTEVVPEVVPGAEPEAEPLDTAEPVATQRLWLSGPPGPVVRPDGLPPAASPWSGLFEPPPREAAGAGAAPAGTAQPSVGGDPAPAAGWTPAAAELARPDEEPRGADSEPAVLKSDRLRYRQLVQQIQRYAEEGYDLLGFAGYPASGKTHAVKALVYLLQGFEADAREFFRREKAPGQSEAQVFTYAFEEGALARSVVIDAGGELYERLRTNDWELTGDSLSLFHSLYRCRGLCLLIHLHEGHFRLGSDGYFDDMAEEERVLEDRAQQAQAELEFVDRLLLFLRALQKEEGKVRKLAAMCIEAGSMDEALLPYRSAPRLELPVAVLFTQADTLFEGRKAIAHDAYLAPASGTMGVAAFVHRHLLYLYNSLLRHARRFRFDFCQSYVEILREHPGGDPRVEPMWRFGDDPLSVGLLPTIEFLLRGRQPEGGLARLLHRLEIETGTAHRFDRLIHPRRWRRGRR